MLRFTSRARTGNIRGLKLTPYLIRGMLGKVGGGGPIDFFRERRLREIASGRKTRVEDTTRFLSKLFFTPSGRQSFSRFLGDIFDEDYTTEQVKDARRKLREMYGDDLQSTRRSGRPPSDQTSDDGSQTVSGRRGRSRRGANNENIVRTLDRIETSIAQTRADVLQSQTDIIKLTAKYSRFYEEIVDVKDDIKSNAESAAQIATSTSRNVLESLTMLQQLVTEKSSSDVDADELFKRIYDLETYQKLILIQLQKKPKSRAKKAKDENQIDLFGESELDSEELVKIIEKNTIEDIHKILVERRPDRADELNQILDAIAKKTSLNIEEDELKEILTKALIEALKQSDCCGKDGSSIAEILKAVLPIGRMLTGISAAVGGITRSIVSTLARYAPRIFSAAGLALAGAGAATAATFKVIGDAEEGFVNKENEKIAPYGIQVIGKNADNQFVYEDIDGNRYTQETMPQKYKDVLEGFSGDTRSRSSQEARKRVEANKKLYTPSTEQKPAVPLAAAPRPEIQIATPPVLQEQIKTLVEQSVPLAQVGMNGNGQPIVTNVYNSTVNNLPAKEKIKVSNNENSYTRLTYQDLDFPQTYGNLNMG